MNTSEQYRNAMAKHYKQLIGHTIIKYALDDNDADIEPFPILITEYRGKQYQVVISKDPEGNGGGFLDINPITMELKNAN
jgi:hypothetical protein